MLSRPRRCVAWQHLDHDPPGLLEAPLRERGWEVEIRQAEDPAGPCAGLADAGVDLVVVMGGTMGAYETDRVPFLAAEIAMLAERLRAGRPVLGVCLGAQLMAAALGARVYPGPRQEIGWLPVTPTPEGAADPVFRLLLAPSPVTIAWHGDTFDPPAGTVALATSEAYAAQAFRHGAGPRASYALQFHPEIPLEDLPAWCELSDPPLTGPPDTPWPAEILEGARAHHAAYARQARAFMHAYLESLETAPGAPGPG